MKRKQGFSKIELIIIVAIIAILVAAALPAFREYMEEAEAESENTIEEVNVQHQ